MEIEFLDETLRTARFNSRVDGEACISRRQGAQILYLKIEQLHSNNSMPINY